VRHLDGAFRISGRAFSSGYPVPSGEVAEWLKAAPC
jgi:hypothetical protein